VKARKLIEHPEKRELVAVLGAIKRPSPIVAVPASAQKRSNMEVGSTRLFQVEEHRYEERMLFAYNFCLAEMTVQIVRA